MTAFDTWLQTPLATSVGWTLFHSLWQGAIIAVLLAAALRMTRSPRGRYTAACLAMCAMVACFFVTLARLAPWHPASGTARNSIALGWNDGVILADLPPAPMHRVADILPYLVPFWMAGVVLFYLRHLASWAIALRLRRTGVCVAPDFWQERLRLLARHLQIAWPVKLFESCLAGVPVVIGHLRPVILMPVGLLTGLPAGQIESILLHELAHIGRGDYLVNMLQTAVEGLLFYHPVVWWISSVMRTEREHCCDDLAVAWSGDAHEYAVALAAFEQTRWGAPETALAATGGKLVNRIRRLLVPTESPSSALTPLVSAGILMIAAAIGLTAWQAKTPAGPAQIPGGTFVAQVAQGQPPKPAPQISPYLKWVEEDVVYIITKEERAAFERLETDDERAQFVEQFWLRRDPTPGTPENEFKEEHYRRIAKANLRFPTALGTAGWRTDRGRIYIVYGPPDEIDDHSSPGAYNRPDNGGAPNAPHSFPYIDWTYRYIENVGTNVQMEFVDKNGSNDFRMTSDPNAR
jgi:GWxTD domain-containing protein